MGTLESGEIHEHELVVVAVDHTADALTGCPGLVGHDRDLERPAR